MTSFSPRWPHITFARLLTVYFTLCLSILLASNSYSRRWTLSVFHPSLHPKILSSNLGSKSSSHVSTKYTWTLPSNDRIAINYNRDDPESRKISQDRLGWFRPLIYMSASRPLVSNRSTTEVFLYGQGITMYSFNGNFTPIGCVIGNDVYPLILKTPIEVYKCEITRKIQPNERLTIAILRDKFVNQAMKQIPLQFKFNISLTLDHDDLYPLPNSTVLRNGLESVLNPRKLVAVRSTVQFEEHNRLDNLDNIRTKPRYEICAMTQMKQYPHLLSPWVDYHRRIGIDMFYIIDNHAPVDLKTLFEGREDVSVFYWPQWKSQEVSWSYMLLQLRDKCEWLILFDADEYIMVGIGKNGREAHKKPLKAFVNKIRKTGVAQSRMYYLLMTESGNVRIPKVAPPEAYIHRASVSEYQSKSIARLDDSWSYSAIHFQVQPGFSATYYSGGGWEHPPIAITDDVTLVHYKSRSLEEFLIKYSTPSNALKDSRDLGRNFSIDLDNPPEWALKTNDSLKYTTFRDVWRSVTALAVTDEQTIVRWRRNQYCKVINKIGSGIMPRSERCINAFARRFF